MIASRSFEAVLQAVETFLKAESWPEKKHITQKQRDLLLTGAIDAVFVFLSEQFRDHPEAVGSLQEHHELLMRCRQEGIDAAFADLIRPNSTPADKLRTLWSEIQRLTRPQQMPRRIELCYQALTLTAHETQPNLWAALHGTLANTLAQTPLGNRADNIEQAIHHYQQALTIYTPQAFPEKWAITQNNLAAACTNRIRDNRADNLEQAIHHYQQALTIYTPQAFPEKWATTQNNLAAAYWSRIRGNRADNLEQAITHFQQALTIYTPQGFPVDWAATQNNLAEALRNRIRGNRANNIEQAITHFQQALTIYTPQAFPADWAMTQNNLANAYSDRIRGHRALNIEQAITHFQQALLIRTRQTFPEKWAATQNSLANAYSDRIRGQRLDNIEKAIYHFEQALTIYTPQAFPADWATTQNNLANAYGNRIRDNRADNLEQAIYHFEQALTILTPPAFPEKWAMTQNNLAVAFDSRIRGNRADNIEQAIYHFEQALTILTRPAFPEKWAGTQNNLANAYSERIRGNRADNLEQAIYHFEQALTILTRPAFAEKWAATQNNLAIAYGNRIRGNRADNLEQAIIHFQQALLVRTPQAFPADWATTQNNLALAYSDRIRGNRADNIEQAIIHFQQALLVRTPQIFPADWAMRQNNLANAFCFRIRGNRADNLEQAIHHYKQALTIYTPQAFPADWAMTQNNLANAYWSRIRGNPADNIEQAIIHFQQALTIYTSQAFPADWAMTQNNLAGAYSERMRGNRADNLEQAIIHFQQALTIYTPPAFPEKWAGTQNNLANAYRDRMRGNRADNLEQAITHFQQALTILTRQAFPEKWATTQNNLASTFYFRMRGNRADNIEQAIHHYQQTLLIYTRQAFPSDWAITQYNIALAYSSRIKGDKALNIEQAIHNYRQALLEYTPVTWPERCRRTAYNLGWLLYNEGRFKEARQALTITHQAVEALRGEIERSGDLRELANENAGLYARLVFCCLHPSLSPSQEEGSQADIEAAFEYAAAGKGRAFVDLLSSARVDLSAMGAENAHFQADWQTYREMRQEIDGLLLILTGDKGAKQVADGQAGLDPLLREVINRQWRDKQQATAQHWQQMTIDYPALTACKSAPSLSATQARDLSRQLNATLVEYYQHTEGWCAFVVTPDEVRHVALPDVDDKLIERMWKWTNRIKWDTGRGPVSYRRLLPWYQAVIAPLNLPSNSGEKGASGEGSAVVLAPFAALHLLPLAVAREPKSLRYVCQDYQLAFAPSLGALKVAHESRSKGKREAKRWQRALLVAYPGNPYLHNVLPESKAIANYFTEPTLLHEDVATPNQVVKEAPNKEVLHLGCHGRFDSQQPEQSGLMLADGWLTVQRIITDLRLKECQLVTLGACESGRLSLGRGDEHVGLIQAIMTAGTPTVMSSLWLVNDLSTRALFEVFYEHIAKGKPPATALREATAHLRQHVEWEHPYYWAPFGVSGLAHGSVRAASSSNFQVKNEKKHIDTTKQEHKRGINPMNETQIMQQAIDLLEQISEDADYFAEKLGPIDGALVVQTLSALSQQTATIQSEAQLLELCDTIYKLIEEVPTLHKLLLGRQTEGDRAVTINDVIATQKQADQRVLALIDQGLENARQPLDEVLPKLDDAQQEEVKGRLSRLLEKLGIK